ncbi:MAG TPA: sulfurtransferase [Gammaproteobacteria bacterium]|nr:sulfurtransferase [Gammaproteobacteria bacterium]
MQDPPFFPVIDSLSLQAQLGENGLKLIDVRPAEAYRQAHLPGAMHFNIEQINAKKPPVSGLLPEPAALDRLFSALGLGPTDMVVVYDEAGGPSAARLAWTLRACGHEQAAMLDAGYSGWLATGGGTEMHVPEIRPSSYKVRLDPRRIANRDYIKTRLPEKTTVLVDARTLPEYAGTDRRTARGGHIPGAVHFDWNDSKESATGHFKPAAELRLRLEALGITPDKEVICYCQSHQRSSVLCLLLETLGYPEVKGYPGAWSDWANASDTPVEISS